MIQPIVESNVFVPHESVAAWTRGCLEAIGMTPADSLAQTSLWGIDYREDATEHPAYTAMSRIAQDYQEREAKR
jgi:hypothetical protein